MSSFSRIILNQGALLRWIVAAPLMFAFAAPAYAELLFVRVNCASSNQDGFTGVACIQEFETSPGTLTPGAPVSTALSGSGPSSSFSASASAKADYGSLGIAAAASLLNSASSENLNTRTGAVVANAFSHWDDRVIISGTPGTNANVLVNYVVDIHSFNRSMSGALGGGLITLNSTSQPGGIAWCLGLSGPGGDVCGPLGSYAPLIVGTNLISFTTQMAVGESIPWVVDFIGSVSATRSAGFDPSAGEASAAFDALDTVQTYFTVLTPGATMQWDSGHDYSVPIAAAVPEPEIYAMLGLGLSLMGWVRRRRKVAP